MPDLLTILGLAAFVLLFAGLSEGFVSRAPLSFPMLFLGLGYLLGSRGIIDPSPESKTLEAVGTVTLALVLFLDAVRMKFDRSPSEWLVPSLVLGPGTILTLLLVAGAAHLLLGLPLASAVLVGAILSSTDPVVVRDIVRDKRIPGAVRQSLRTEAATNDLVVLPVVLVTIAIVKSEASTFAEWALILGKLLCRRTTILERIGDCRFRPEDQSLDWTAVDGQLIEASVGLDLESWPPFVLLADVWLHDPDRAHENYVVVFDLRSARRSRR